MVVESKNQTQKSISINFLIMRISQKLKIEKIPK